MTKIFFYFQFIGNVFKAGILLKLGLLKYIESTVTSWLNERSIEEVIGLLDRKDLEKYTKIASRAFEMYTDMNENNTSE